MNGRYRLGKVKQELNIECKVYDIEGKTGNKYWMEGIRIEGKTGTTYWMDLTLRLVWLEFRNLKNWTERGAGALYIRRGV